MDIQEYFPVISKTIHKYLDFDKTYVFLFGSRAIGSEQHPSDIDIGLYTGETIPSHVMIDIQSDLEESRIPVKVDVVDFSNVTDNFRKIALEKIQIWNHPKNNLKLN